MDTCNKELDQKHIFIQLNLIITFALMNRVALILTFFIGFMIVQPTLAFIDPIFEIEAGEDGCVDEEGDCEGACNPFLSCDTCLGFFRYCC